MRYSANLNIIIKAIEKATAHVSRDFSELEVLQTNPASCVKFANSCYSKVKKILIEDFSQIRPDFDLVFSDGQEILRGENSEYSFVIFPIDGLLNLSRAIPDFCCAIALQYGKRGERQTISVALYKPISNDFFYCEKGYGAFLNNRRIRVSKRKNDDNLLAISQNFEVFENVKNDFELKKISVRNFGSKILEMAMIACGRVDLALFDAKDYEENLQDFELLISESLGRVMQYEDMILVSSDAINFV